MKNFQTTKKVLITGSSGFIGGHLAKALKNEYDLSLPDLDYNQLLTDDDWLQYLNNIDCVINCVGIISETKNRNFDTIHYIAPVALFKACEKAAVKKVIQISALGADDSAITRYHKTKKQADDFLKTTHLEWFILKPSLVFGEGGKSHTFFKKFSNLPIIPLIGSGQQLIQPVDIDTLIKAVNICLETKQQNQEVNIVGEKPISFKNWLLKLRTKISKPLFIPVPVFLVRFLAFLLKPFKPQFLSSDNITMLQQNNTGDYVPLKRFLEESK